MSMFSASSHTPKMLVIQHSELSHGGVFCKGLSDRGVQLTTLNPCDGDALPLETEGYDGLVVLGGPQSPLDDEANPHFPQLLELMRLFDRHNKPVAGICLGSQLLARAHGGRPKSMGVLEFGLVPLSLTTQGAVDPVVGGIEIPPLMEFHEYTFDLPAGATLLVQGEQCINQGFKVGNISYGFQFHLEVDSKTMEAWIDIFKNNKLEGCVKYRSAYSDAFFAQLEASVSSAMERSEKYCDRIVEGWMGLMDKKCSYRVLRT